MRAGSTTPAGAAPAPGDAQAPAWANWLGITAIVLGVFLTAAQATEAMKHWVLRPPTETVIDPRCPRDELHEEHISLAMCRQTVAQINTMLLSRPDWYRPYKVGLSLLGAGIAFWSIFVGIALIDARRWAPLAALATFAALACVDLADFIAIVGVGPMLRAAYLAQLLLWLILHIGMSTAVVAARHGDGAAA